MFLFLQAVGVDISNCPDVNITAVSEFMVKILSQSTKQLDDIYFGLVLCMCLYLIWLFYCCIVIKVRWY